MSVNTFRFSLSCLFVAAFLFMSTCLFAEDTSTSVNFVMDQEDLFSDMQEQELNTIIKEYVLRTNNEIDIVTVNSFAPFASLYEYSMDLSKNWTPLHTESPNILLIVLSKKLRGVYVLTAYGTEKLIQNDVCRHIIDADMMPGYAKQDYFMGTKQGLLQLMKEWN